MKRFFDYDSGEYTTEISGSLIMGDDGDLLQRMGKNMALDLDSGELHTISSVFDDDEN
jgi:hypothetical protein